MRSVRFFILDSYSVLYMAILLAAAGFVFLFAYDYLDRRQEHREEFYLLVLLATTGSMVLAASRNFASLFLGLELLSVALYALIAYLRHERVCIEAGIKYLVLAASSSSVLLFGLALIYSETGSMDLSQFVTISNSGPGGSVVLLAGTMLALVGIGFKLAVVPFHMWTPDVYEGAPLPVTAFVATVSKGGMFALVLRWFHPAASGGLRGATGAVLAVIAIASMLSGNLLALRQMNVKRILAYSSIAHMGYLLVALLAGGALGLAAGTYYLIAYLVTILGAFGTMTALSGARREAASIESYRGLFWERPMVAGVFTTMLLSLAGIPSDRGISREVLRSDGGRSAVALDSSVHVGSEQHDRALLLSAHRGRDDREAAGGGDHQRRRHGSCPACGCGCAGCVDWSGVPARGLPLCAVEHHRRRDAKPGLIFWHF